MVRVHGLESQSVVNQQRIRLLTKQFVPVGPFMPVFPVVEKAKTGLDESQAELMRSFGIEPTERSIRKYLLGLIPAADVDEQIAPLVEKLSDEAFDVREQATEQLKYFPGLTPEWIRLQITEARNPETRMRLGDVLQWLEQPDTPRVQYAVFQKIEEIPIENLASAIAQSAPYLSDQDYLHRAVSRALAVTATAADIPLMTELIEDRLAGAWIRTGALQALMRIEPESTTKRLKGLAQEASGNFGIEVARQLVLAQDASCFEVLIRLTGDENRSVATQAWSALRGLTATKVPLNALLDPVSRSGQIDQIRIDITENSDQIKFEWNSHGNKLGRVLVADYEKSIVREFDSTGQLTWSYESNSAFACQGLPNGHRLVTSYSANELLEFDEQGTLISTIKLLHGSASSINRLDNGNTLVSSAGGNVPIVEYSPDGTSVREIKVDDMVTAVELLENGNLFVAMFNSSVIAEVDELGNQVWNLSVGDQPYHATRLDSGNILVSFCNTKEVREYTAGGDIVWSHKTAAKPFRVQRLVDGTTVIAGPNGIVFVAPDGTETSLIEGVEFGDTLFFHYF